MRIYLQNQLEQPGATKDCCTLVNETWAHLRYHTEDTLGTTLLLPFWKVLLELLLWELEVCEHVFLGGFRMDCHEEIAGHTKTVYDAAPASEQEHLLSLRLTILPCRAPFWGAGNPLLPFCVTDQRCFAWSRRKSSFAPWKHVSHFWKKKKKNEKMLVSCTGSPYKEYTVKVFH